MAQTAQFNGTAATLRGLATRPLTLALAAIAAMLIVGEILSPRFAAPSQIVSQLTIAALLGIVAAGQNLVILRSEEHTSELQSLMRISYAVFCLKKKKLTNMHTLQPLMTELS